MNYEKLTDISTAPEAVKDLFKAALLARERSYSPYSEQKVGAAVRTEDGKIYGGCNIENSSYGATNCAERVAIQKAISDHGLTKITAVLVITKATPPWPPCGMCRQVISEFGENPVIYTANIDGKMETYTLNELLPQAFGAAHLRK